MGEGEGGGERNCLFEKTLKCDISVLGNRACAVAIGWLQRTYGFVCPFEVSRAS